MPAREIMVRPGHEMKKFFLLLIICWSLLSCAGYDAARRQPSGTGPAVSTTEYVTGSGKTFIVVEDHSLGASLVRVKVETRGFAEVNGFVDLGEMDPVEKVFLADLDGDGFEELYLVTRSAGSGSYATVYGLASNKDKSATLIHVPALAEKDFRQGAFFAGFGGHNTIDLRDGRLVNSFPVFDDHYRRTGATRDVFYDLVAGEAAWILKPVIMKTIDRSNGGSAVMPRR